MTEVRVAGVDEAGRGALAGPVVCAAVILGSEIKIDNLTDSKKLTYKQRRRLSKQIKKYCVSWAIGVGSVEEIDRYNILKTTMLGMKRAIESLECEPDLVLVDGNQRPDIRVPVQAIVKGDLYVPVISAASILAKHTRDKLMHAYEKEYPEYGLRSNVGYGTPFHLQALRINGATAIHRKSFAPVRQVIERSRPSFFS
ncbi:MAG: ribonuclease HII [Acidiferrobacterales bacterium]|nr:ribonuclease HII [Acidiferrobacterales bacterium]